MGRLVRYKSGNAIISQGGLPDEIWQHPIARNYTGNKEGKRISVTKNIVAGYFGSDNRTKKIDKLVVNQLRKEGLSNTEIAEWLTSTSGRHMMDNPDRVSILDSLKYAPDDLDRWKKSELEYYSKKRKKLDEVM